MEQADGLRARKKRETRRALERAALQLVAENGYEETTIDDICARANVSRMTFFNYFPTKLSAVLGQESKPPSAQDMERVLEKCPYDCYIDALIHLLAEGFASKIDPEMQELRCTILERDTSLLLKEQRGANKNRRAIGETLEEFLTAHPEQRMLDDVTLEEEVFLGSSFAIHIAHVLTYRRLFKGEELAPADVRRLFAAYTQA